MISSISIGLLALLTLSIPVGIVLFLLGFGIDVFLSPFPLTKGLGNLVWSTSNNATLIAIPFFVLLGEILVRSGIATLARMLRLTAGCPGFPAGWFMRMSPRRPCFQRFPVRLLQQRQPWPQLQCRRPRSWATTPGSFRAPLPLAAHWAS